MAVSARFIATAVFLVVLVRGDYQKLTLTSYKVPKASSYRLCRDRFGLADEVLYRRRACVLCYSYLFPVGTGGLIVHAPPRAEFLQIMNSANETETGNGETNIVELDPINATTLDSVCVRLPTDDDCSRLKQCCRSAVECCQEQQLMASRQSRLPDASSSSTFGLRIGTRSVQTEVVVCASTWDGFSCWDETAAGHTVKQPCPAFIEKADLSQYSHKLCTESGKWYDKDGWEWTDYTPCLDTQAYFTSVNVSVCFSAASLVFLVPALIIFTCFRDLYRQDRVRLHIHFFLSLTLVNVVSIAWYLLVHREFLVNPVMSHTVINQNPIWCRVLSFLKIYLTSTNYFWMFCEGFYLHRLISYAFEAPSSMIGLYLVGWIAPSVSAISYAAVRISSFNDSCWIKNSGVYQWIIYLPNFFCLVVNSLFLCNILRTLLFQLHSHPHEPSSFRRALKAGFMLIPLFGIQLLLTIYRPESNAAGRQYEFVTVAVTNSQGIFVSLLFCFFNGEILAHLKRFCHRLCGQDHRFKGFFSRAAYWNDTTVHGGTGSPNASRVTRLASCGSPLQAVAGSSRQLTLLQRLQRRDTSAGPADHADVIIQLKKLDRPHVGSVDSVDSIDSQPTTSTGCGPSLLRSSPTGYVQLNHGHGHGHR